MSSVSDRLDLSKSTVLNAAVRLALAEQRILDENRKFLTDRGVDAAFVAGEEKGGGALGRSSTLILVKNLPHDSSGDELTALFCSHGSGGGGGGGKSGRAPSSVTLSPSRTVALVLYGHRDDARRAFRRMSYRRYGNVPLYLTWAPLLASSKAKEEGARDGRRRRRGGGQGGGGRQGSPT